ncbi:hypothetical protein [Methanorbis furvi]|uniref:Uncharacterized protein n=1 Tax=Methanorbis furvi TaxID=3028299 RepID=A0AAE4S9U8_9EURY|nr:hypothetical protein [Methanocorpusculaceae archaeon Ag1]
MTEHDTVLYLCEPATIADIYRGVTYPAATTARFTSPENRTRYPKETTYTCNTAPGTRSGWVPAGERQAVRQRSDRMTISGIYRGKTYTAKTSHVPAMYTERDRIPRIGVHQTVTGYGIADCDVLISGKLGITTAAKTDARGVWWAYLPVDDYTKASIRSFVENGGKVYKMLKQTEREEGYIWDEVMQCITRTGNGFRMISRMV